MSTMQIRNVPESLSRTLKARAAASGMSLSDYLLQELTRGASKPSIAELQDRIDRSARPDLPPAADTLAEARATRS